MKRDLEWWKEQVVYWAKESREHEVTALRHAGDDRFFSWLYRMGMMGWTYVIHKMATQVVIRRSVATGTLDQGLFDELVRRESAPASEPDTGSSQSTRGPESLPN